MNDSTPFDLQECHRRLSATAFNAAWDLMETTQRTPEQDELMLAAAYASLWHWSQRPDVTAQHRSVGYWQIARIYALLGRATDALRYGESCLVEAADEVPFYRAYAHEAQARAYQLADNATAAEQHLRAAWELAAEVDDPEDREMLEADLRTLSP